MATLACGVSVRTAGLGCRLVPRVRRLLSGTTVAAAPEFRYADLFSAETPKDVKYRRVPGTEGMTRLRELGGKHVLEVEPKALTALAATAMRDIAHLLRPGHLAQLRKILDDPESSANDRFVALELLKNANIASGMVLPGCQDTGTAIVVGKRGRYVWSTDDNVSDEEALSRGVFDTYTKTNLRYSQVAPLDMFTEKNTGSNLPAQIDLFADSHHPLEYKFLFTEQLVRND